MFIISVQKKEINKLKGNNIVVLGVTNTAV